MSCATSGQVVALEDQSNLTFYRYFSQCKYSISLLADASITYQLFTLVHSLINCLGRLENSCCLGADLILIKRIN